MNESLWIDIIMALSCAVCGGVCGWISHAIGGGPVSTTSPRNTSPIADRTGDEPADRSVDTEQSLTEVAKALQTHARSMTQNVDSHQLAVTSISDVLNRSETATPELIAETVRQIVQANETMRSQLATAQDQIHQQTLALATAEERAVTDALTQVPNRGAFDKHIDGRVQIGSSRPGQSTHAGVLALFDVDHFKKFNDQYGHRAGDEVLCTVARTLHRQLNSLGLVARYGGEEFAIIIDNQTLDQAGPIIERARRAVGMQTVQFEGESLRVTASIGVAQYQTDETTAQWIERADAALYHSKSEGRDCTHAMTGDGPQRVELPLPTTIASEPADMTGGGESPMAEPDADEMPPALAYLPDQVAMGKTFLDIRDRAGAVDVSLIMLSVPDGTPAATFKTLLPTVRSNLRNVDTLGCLDHRTLMVLLPSVTQAAATQRVHDIVSAAKDVGLDGDRVLRSAVAAAEPDETFDQLVECVQGQLA